MRGTASSQTTTGQVQRVLTGEWKTQGRLMADADLHSFSVITMTALLERLVREGRAEQRWVSLPAAESMAGGRREYRAATKSGSREAV